jgi:hypothetical protein
MKQLFIVEGKFERQHCQSYYPHDTATACGAQSEMKEPKKFSLALITGVLLTSALILLVSMALLFGSADGTVGGLFNSGA